MSGDMAYMRLVYTPGVVQVVLQDFGKKDKW